MERKWAGKEVYLHILGQEAGLQEPRKAELAVGFQETADKIGGCEWCSQPDQASSGISVVGLGTFPNCNRKILEFPLIFRMNANKASV